MSLTKKILPLAALLAVALPGSALAAPKSKFRYTQATYVTSEAAATATVTITRASGRGANGHGKSRVNQDASVNWSITGGSATDGVDYTYSPAQGKLTFAGCQNPHPAATDPCVTQTITFAITEDSDVEPLESVQLKLSAASRTALVTNPRSAQLVIVDDDGPDQVDLIPGSQNVNEAGGTASYYAVRSGQVTGDATVGYATADGAGADDSFNAHAPADYGLTAGTATFHAATATTPPDYVQPIAVPIVDDSVIENSESFGLTLSNLTGGPAFPNGAGSVTGTTTIIDNDSPPVFALDASSYVVNEDGSVDVTVQRLANTSAPTAVSAADVFDVNWKTTDGTATNPADYIPSADQQLEFDSTDDAETITIAANDADTQITLIDDSLYEGNETFNLSLAGATVEAGGDGIQPSIGSPSSATVTIHDNDTAPPATGGTNGDGSSPAGSSGTGATDNGSGGATGQVDGGDQLVLGARQAGCGLVVKATKKQRLAKRKVLKLKLRAGKRCKVSITTTIRKVRVAKHKRQAEIVRSLKFRGKKTSLTLQPGKAKTVKVKFTRKTLKAIRKALRAHTKLVATVVVTTRDSASKVSRKTLKITIRR